MKRWHGLLLGLWLATAATMMPVAAADDPLTVVQRFFDARNRYDVAAAAALVTDDLRFVGGPNCTPANPCIGPAGVRAELTNNMIPNHAQVTIVGTPQVTGMTVVVRSEARSDVFRAVGLERTVNITTITVRDGKIASYSGVFDMSDPQTAQYLALQRAPQGLPPTPTPPAPPRTGGGGEVSFIHRLGDG